MFEIILGLLDYYNDVNSRMYRGIENGLYKAFNVSCLTGEVCVIRRESFAVNAGQDRYFILF